jgi:Fe2+ transport system protein B
VSFLLGLPEASGIVLFIGILRKELSMIMLFQAMHTTDLNTVMTNIQLITFTIFIIFYMPCIATIGVMIKEVGIRKAIIITFLTIIFAMFLSTVVRLILSII